MTLWHCIVSKCPYCSHMLHTIIDQSPFPLFIRTFFTLMASTSLVHVLPAVSYVGETLNLDHCLVPESAEPGSDQMGSAESSPNGKECFPQKSGTIPDESTLASGIQPDKSSLHPPISKQPPSTTEGPLPRERIAFITLTSTTTTPVKKWERPYFLVECHNPDSSMRPFEAQFDDHSSQHEPLSDDTVQHT